MASMKRNTHRPIKSTAGVINLSCALAYELFSASLKLEPGAPCLEVVLDCMLAVEVVCGIGVLPGAVVGVVPTVSVGEGVPVCVEVGVMPGVGTPGEGVTGTGVWPTGVGKIPGLPGVDVSVAPGAGVAVPFLPKGPGDSVRETAAR
jgi:hypothetical protein